MNTRLRIPPRPFCQCNPSQSSILHDELIAEILSRLPVKSLMQMKCVCKSWKTLISHPTFIKMHLLHSAQNPYSYIVSHTNNVSSFVVFSVDYLLKNHHITLPKDSYFRVNDKHPNYGLNHLDDIDEDCPDVVGSCNGLVCLLGYSLSMVDWDAHTESWLRFWNPATRTISDKLVFLHHVGGEWVECEWYVWNFVFGYDNSTDTYKVVALKTDDREVRVFSLGENVWRTIQSCPVVPLDDGVHFSCSVNWLGTKHGNVDNVFKEFMIISLDLTTETYTNFLLPSGYEKELVGPGVCVLMNSLCCYDDFEGTRFVIWKMTEFGNDKSWTKLLEISGDNLRTMTYKLDIRSMDLRLRPLHVSEDGDTIVFANNIQKRAIFYNWRTKIVKKTRINKKINWFSMKDYVESLVPTS